MSCEHYKFRVNGNVIRLTDEAGATVVGYTVDFTVHCDQCGLPFRFRGQQYGSSPDHPALSADGLELRAPIEPALAPEILGHPVRFGRA
jgi:hypothetical protein